MLRHLIIAFATSGALLAQQPRELGTITWARDFDAATQTAQKSGRPLLVLFQEVPG